MKQHNSFKRDIDLLSEAYAQIYRESSENYIEKREDGYKVEYEEVLEDDNSYFFTKIHTPEGEVVSADDKSIDAIIDYHKEHGEFPAAVNGLVRHPDYKSPL